MGKKYLFFLYHKKKTSIFTNYFKVIIVMPKKIKSEGKCFYCGKSFAKAGTNRHLAAHLNEKIVKGKQGKSFLIKLDADKRMGETPYFLNIWIDSEATLKTIDLFLRDIWLDCCEHQSAFRNPKAALRGGSMLGTIDVNDEQEKDFAKYGKIMGDVGGVIPMNRKLKDLFYKGLVLEYEYDFGNSTFLILSVMEEYQMKSDKEIMLLSRNEPEILMCTECKKVPATQICTSCMIIEDTFLCDKCAKKHSETCEDFAKNPSLPIVNSPRMGVCKYKGGKIDKERDRVSFLYLIKK